MGLAYVIKFSNSKVIVLETISKQNWKELKYLISQVESNDNELVHISSNK